MSVENVTRIKIVTTINVNASVKIRKNIVYVYEKDYICDLATCICKNGTDLASIIDDSVVTCDAIIDTTKIVPTNFNEKR